MIFLTIIVSNNVLNCSVLDNSRVDKPHPLTPAASDPPATNKPVTSQTISSITPAIADRVEVVQDGGNQKQEEVLPQFPAGVGGAKRYSARRQKQPTGESG